jgi:hypothetical protein
LNAVDPTGLSGTLTIYSDYGNALASLWGGNTGHSYISYTPDQTGVSWTRGTYGNNPNGAGYGVLVDVDTYTTSAVTRQAWLSDNAEARLYATINYYSSLGDEGWTAPGGITGPCSSFASAAWNASTGESSNPYNAFGISTPSALADSIKAANGGENYGYKGSSSDSAGSNLNYITVVVSAPPPSQNEQAKLKGLARLAWVYNPFWGYLPTTNTTNWAGGIAGLNRLGGGGSPWNLSNQRGGINWTPGGVTIGEGFHGYEPAECFVAGTPVLMADGSEKPIESIQVGEAVLAWNEETKTIFSTKVVSALHHDEKLETLFDIELDDGRTFTTNNNHPMYVVEDGDFKFTDELAGRFAKGEPVTFQDNNNQPVRITSLRMRRQTCKMYNLHVEGQGKNGHTYYANGILVHNSAAGLREK